MKGEEREILYEGRRERRYCMKGGYKGVLWMVENDVNSRREIHVSQ